MNDLTPLPRVEPGRYRHYKGLDYELIGVVRHSESLAPLVLYRPLYGVPGSSSDLWVRPHAMFHETVVIDGVERPRFEKLPDAASDAGLHAGLDAAAIVDEGLMRFNAEQAPMHEVHALRCFEADAQGRVIAGAVGRLWRDCAELLQLWVHDQHRGQGVGRRVLQAFERDAAAHGARQVFLETFSFQALGFYARCDYATDWVNSRFPHGICKHHMSREIVGPQVRPAGTANVT